MYFTFRFISPWGDVLGEYLYNTHKNVDGSMDVSFSHVVFMNEQVFNHMYKLLRKKEPSFKECERYKPGYCKGYRSYRNYRFESKEYGPIKLDTKFSCVIKAKSEVDKMNDKRYTYDEVFINDMEIKEPIYITVVPEYCQLCKYRGQKYLVKKHYNSADKNIDEYYNNVTTECINCTREIDEYEKKEKEQLGLDDDYYSKWNGNQCDRCESYGHMCKACRSY